MPRHNTHKPDGNQKAIIDKLRQLGVSVISLSNVGDGCPDIVVGFRNKNYLFEIKNPEHAPSQQKLRPKQQKFFDTWAGQVSKVLTVEDILEEIGYIVNN